MPRAFVAALAALLLALAADRAAAGETLVVRTVQASFDEVAAFLQEAIQGKGLVIDNISRVGEMLARTAGDVGATRKVYRRAEVYQFCSARYSRAMVEADPRNLAFCPYRIALYELADRPGLVHVAYWRLAPLAPPGSGKALADVDALVESIVGDALGLF
ncbi:DUF302 domain-containing protein [Inmirania thermothiophila]|uniref:Uncharacterized protein (DUF302 family) n=1 Tax=Inmirania thermothiophila TaxID=1750597 RepID=A0A3N1Y033_9GAMM|nr:DUF302 domain-containing protein [Inmirania thermothiophila]ROR32203.1 uncharacterized protein (DUF302 family) [Inmirania thermothiophila]